MTRFYVLDPEVAGGFGERTVIEGEGHPPVVKHLHYEIESWLGDDLITSFPCFLVSERVAKALANLTPSGCEIADAEVTEADNLRRVQPHIQLPTFKWLRIFGEPGVDDLGMSRASGYNPVVSERVLLCLRDFSLSNCGTEVWKPLNT